VGANIPLFWEGGQCEWREKKNRKEGTVSISGQRERNPSQKIEWWNPILTSEGNHREERKKVGGGENRDLGTLIS